MVISNLLLGYDFEFEGAVEGVGKRPDNIRLHEYVFPAPDAKVLFKLRKSDSN